MKIRRDLVDYVYFAVFGIFLVLFLTGQFTNVTGTSLVVIDNADPNSMFPTYFQGDLFVIHKDDPSDIEIGDVIVYLTNNGNRVIHRVIDIYISQVGEYYFRVKGDNPISNFRPDGYSSGTFIPFDSVLGKAVIRLPYIGHISLALQKNLVVQMFVYLSAFAIIVAIIFWPEDEDEEEEEFYNITKESINQAMQNFLSKIRKLFGVFTSSNHKLLAWILLIMLVLVGFIPFFLPTYLPINTDVERGVLAVSFDEPIELPESSPRPDSVFYNVFITMHDDGNLFNYIDGYTLQVIHNGELVDETVWKTMRRIKGNFTVGGSITLPTSFTSTIVNGSELTLQITVEIDEFFGQSTLDPYVTSFQYIE